MSRESLPRGLGFWITRAIMAFDIIVGIVGLPFAFLLSAFGSASLLLACVFLLVDAFVVRKPVGWLLRYIVLTRMAVIVVGIFGAGRYSQVVPELGTLATVWLILSILLIVQLMAQSKTVKTA